MRGPCEPTNRFKSPMLSCLISGRTFRKHAPQGCGRLQVDENYDMQRPSNGAIIHDPSIANRLYEEANGTSVPSPSIRLKKKVKVKPCLQVR